jgi:xanthine dehydrogenase accessory factor
MSEIQDILNLHERVSLQSENFAFATVIQTDGPSYRSAGARSLIVEDGTFRGGLSAGCLEGDIACRLDGGTKPFIVEYDLSTEDDLRGFPFGCGGTVQIFVEPLPNADALNAMRWLGELRQPAALATVVRVNDRGKDLNPITVGARYGVSASGSCRFESGLSDVEAICLDAFALKKSKIEIVQQSNQELTVFVEYFEPAIEICIFGDGEDARFLDSLATNIGMNVHRFSRQQIRSSNHFQEEIPALRLSYIVVMTHDLNLDTKVIGQITATMPPYLGVMGPRSRTERILTGLNLDAQDILNHPNFYSPVGLNMAAETPQEIALSVLSEIQTVARNAKAGHLRDSTGAIHDRGRFIDAKTQISV